MICRIYSKFRVYIKNILSSTFLWQNGSLCVIMNSLLSITLKEEMNDSLLRTPESSGFMCCLPYIGGLGSLSGTSYIWDPDSSVLWMLYPQHRSWCFHMKDCPCRRGDDDGVRYAHNICWFYSVKSVCVALQEMESWLCQDRSLRSSRGLLYWAVTNGTVRNFQSCLIVVLLCEHGLDYLRATTWLPTQRSCCYSKDQKSLLVNGLFETDSKERSKE